MKKLYLIRHAKASWEHPEQEDIARPLTPQGEEDAKDMAHLLKKHKVGVDLMLSSTAVRAIATAKIMAQELDYKFDKIITNERIYNGGVEELVEIIKEIPSKEKTVLLFGHNPSLTWLAHYLCETFRMNLATCGVLGISFDVKSWSDLSSVEGTFIDYYHPHHEHHG